MFKCHAVTSRQWAAVADSVVSKWSQGAAGATRQLSSTASRASEDNSSTKGPQKVSPPSSSSSLPPIRRVSNDGRAPPQRRPIDIRALGTRINTSGEKPTKILRASPNLRLGGGRPTFGARPGTGVRGPQGNNNRGPNRGPKPTGPRRRSKNLSSQDSGANSSSFRTEMTPQERAAEEAAYLEQWENDRVKPVRYAPQGSSVENLQRTWPALPIGETGPVEALHERLVWMSERYVNSFEPTDLLAQRIHKGEWVYFNSEQEKNEAVEAAKKMAAERAEMLTERKAEVIEPEDMSFKPMNETQRKQLVSRLVTGEYEQEVKEERDTVPSHPFYTDVLRNLRNNPTYQGPHREQFLDVLATAMPKVKGQPRAKA
ncbi:hypothetical protein FQN55_003045 [Onygenales sp. PD_40]|nr:hypothetical protein FQN55_003045 [Onygenales sp. PD_40]KAK2784511.1 hypothetical protein FQN51_004073 [Onygenales sp. PD_10]KAK2796030.1 hypothetical protein FQN52_000003 [Onygenales sp. PD_12]